MTSRYFYYFTLISYVFYEVINYLFYLSVIAYVKFIDTCNSVMRVVLFFLEKFNISKFLGIFKYLTSYKFITFPSIINKYYYINTCHWNKKFIYISDSEFPFIKKNVC